MVYEAVRDIAAGEELLLGVREPLQLQDMLGENTTEDRSDRETGEYRILPSCHRRVTLLPSFNALLLTIGDYSVTDPMELFLRLLTRAKNKLIKNSRGTMKKKVECWPTDATAEIGVEVKDNRTY